MIPRATGPARRSNRSPSKLYRADSASQLRARPLERKPAKCSIWHARLLRLALYLWRAIVFRIKAGVVHLAINLNPIGMVDSPRVLARWTHGISTRNMNPAT